MYRSTTRRDIRGAIGTGQVTGNASRKRSIWFHLAGALVGAATGLAFLAPAATAAPLTSVTCGQVVSKNVTLQADLVCPHGGGLVVAGAPSITIDLNGHRVVGSGASGAGTGIRLESATHVTVKGGSVVGFETAVVVLAPATLLNLAITGEAPASLGATDLIVSAPVAASQVHGNGTVTLDSPTTSSIKGSTFDNVSFASVVADVAAGTTWTHSTLPSVLLVSSPGGVFDGDFLGTVLLHQSDNNIIRHSFIGSMNDSQSAGTVIDQNWFAGGHPVGLEVGADSSANQQVTGNLFVGYDLGLRLDGQFGGGFDGTVISGNSFWWNGVAGADIRLLLGQPSIKVSANTFGFNGGGPNHPTDPGGHAVNDGLHVYVAPGHGTATLTGNVAVLNADEGIEAYGVVDGGGNHAFANTNPVQCHGLSC
jgi:hypothetical protein